MCIYSSSHCQSLVRVFYDPDDLIHSPCNIIRHQIILITSQLTKIMQLFKKVDLPPITPLNTYTIISPNNESSHSFFLSLLSLLEQFSQIKSETDIIHSRFETKLTLKNRVPECSISDKRIDQDINVEMVLKFRHHFDVGEDDIAVVMFDVNDPDSVEWAKDVG